MGVHLIVQIQLTWLGMGDSGGVGFFPYFPPLKPRYVLWSGASYSPKNMVAFSPEASPIPHPRWGKSAIKASSFMALSLTIATSVASEQGR